MSTEPIATPDVTPQVGGASPDLLSGVEPSRLGSAMYYLLPIRRRIIMGNLRRVFGERYEEHDLRRVARAFYGHFARSIVEYLSMLFMSERKIVANVDVEGIEHLLEAEKKNRGILVLTGHFGNWELASVGAMLQHQQYRERFHIVRKSLSAGLERLVFGRFRSAGLRVIPRYDALGRVLKALENNDVAIFIMDQATKIKSAKGIAVDFFGDPAGTNRSLALVAAHSGAPVIPATAYRRADGSHVLRFESPLPWIAHEDTEEEVRQNTRQYNQVLERFVLEHPEQWFWMHRRWK